MSLTAAVWPQFATQVFRGGIGRLTCIGSYVNKQVTTFTFRAQAATCSKHHTRTVMDAGCECAPWVRSAVPSDSWALVFIVSTSASDRLRNDLWCVEWDVKLTHFHYMVCVMIMLVMMPVVCLHQIESDIIELMEKALQYTDVFVGCSSAHHELAVQYRTGKIHHRLASLYHNALRNDASSVSSSLQHSTVQYVLYEYILRAAEICNELIG